MLLAGGWLLVKAAARLSLAFGISPLIVGATVVALGTSSPELSVSMAAAVEGSGGLAVGNILGSNVTNVLLVLGIAVADTPNGRPSEPAALGDARAGRRDNCGHRGGD